MIHETGVYYIEIVTDQVDAVRAAHENAYGFRFERVPALGNALVARLGGGQRCGIRAPMHAAEKPVVRTYVKVDDVDRALAAVQAQGAFVAMSPLEIAGEGKVAIYVLGGVEQGIWQLP